MTLRGSWPAACALACSVLLATPSHPAPPSPWMPARPAPAAPDTAARRDRSREVWIDGVPDTGQFLADTVLLARVDKRTIRVRGYIETYFASYAEYRPRPDTEGRKEFLNSMINKEVLGLTALAINRPFGFEDRVVMREHTQRVLSNVLFQRGVLDSITFTEEELKAVYEQHKIAQHLRHILFAHRADAEKVRKDLIAGRISWKEAVRKYSVAPEEDRQRDGDLGWHSRFGFDAVIAFKVFALKPGEYTQVLSHPHGFELIQATERHASNPPSYQDIRSGIVNEVRNLKMGERTETLRAQVRVQIGMTYDTTNVDWAWRHFTPTVSTTMEAGAPTLNFNADLPEFTPADTSRVLARHRYGQLSLGQFLDALGAISPLLRPSVNDPESMRAQVDAFVLEPYMAEMAVHRGLDRDSMAVHMIESRREALLVEHLYADSITSKVWVRPEERRKYYKDHLPDFITYPRVTFAGMVRDSRAAADSLAGRLRAGEKAADMLRADSLLGRTTGSIQERSANDHGSPYYKLLFEELRPGKVAVEGPDKQGDYAVIQLLKFDSGRQLSYEESEHMIDESLQNIRAEEKLKAFLERRKKLYRIEAHPELLDRVRLVDPTLFE